MVRSVLLYTEITHLISYSYTSTLLQQKRYDTSVFLLCCSKERSLTVLQWKRKKKSDVTKTGNGERGAGNGERKSGNELSAETSIKIQNGR